MAEALSFSGVDWICIDMQHGAVGYSELSNLIRGVALGKAKSIVRVGGPDDRFGIQQALDLGADGVMVPIVNTAAQAQQAVSYCLFPPQGQRSAVYPSPAAVRRSAPGCPGGKALASYLSHANKEVEVWLQIETRECLQHLGDILSVPGVTCAFLGPADMALSLGLHTAHGYDLAAAMASAEMASVYDQVLKSCKKHSVKPGVFCVGAARAAELAAQGFMHIGFEVDTNMLANSAAASMAQLKKPAQ